MYFREPNGGNARILKAIDFGASKLLKEADRELTVEELKNRANFCRQVDTAVTTLRYDGPEINYKNVCFNMSWEESAERTADHNLV
jgi:hypothetical protein